MTCREKSNQLQTNNMEYGLYQDLARLFDTTKLYSTRGTANEKGTGFGLMLCKKFLEEHGGEIWAESELGRGSKFKFTLPLNE